MTLDEIALHWRNNAGFLKSLKDDETFWLRLVDNPDDNVIYAVTNDIKAVTGPRSVLLERYKRVLKANGFNKDVMVVKETYDVFATLFALDM